jgi:hypothetical protein
MNAANDLDPIAEELRRERVQALLRRSMRILLDLRLASAKLDTGDPGTWQQVRSFSQELVRESTLLDLPLLLACAREALVFAEKRFAGAPLYPDLVLYMLSALDTLAMEVERLRHDRDLR